MNQNVSRRDFFKETAALGAAVAAMHAAEGLGAAETKAGDLPKIRLGTLEVSRLILGSNPFFGYAHQPGDIGRRMEEYYTDERIVEVLEAAAALGVTAVTAPPSPRWIKLYSKYVDQGGKVRIWIAQPHNGPDKIKAEIIAAAKAGAKAMFIQGHRAEVQFEQGKLDLVRSWVEHIKSCGVPAGMAAHRPDVHLAAEKAGFPTDFYFQCLFQPETYELEQREKAVETIRQLTKPVIAYKILAAGRLKPKEAFEFAFRHIAAKDGVCVGVFPKANPDMLAEDVTLVQRLSKPK